LRRHRTEQPLKGRVLIIAGSDSGGGAGIQADIKTVTALGAFAMTAVTALTAQNTRGVSAIHDVPAAFVVDQMRAVLSDIGADSVKTGMLHRADIIEAIADALEAECSRIPIVIDPVMTAKGGHALLEEQAVRALKSRLLPLAGVLTPNIPEAEALTGMKINNHDDARRAIRLLAALGPRAVLLKGGHLAGDMIIDLLLADGELHVFEDPRINTRNTHGTGCTLASAVAAGLAQGKTVKDAVKTARAYVQEAIRTAPGLGGGHGPLNHAHTVKPFTG